MKAPCHKCPDRKLACHGECERWAEYQRDKEAKKSFLSNTNGLDYQIESVHRQNKSMKQKPHQPNLH